MTDTVAYCPVCPETGEAMFRDTRPMTISYRVKKQRLTCRVGIVMQAKRAFTVDQT